MAGGGDQGFFLGMMAARRARERRGEGQTGRSSGGGALFNIFPKMVIPVIIYAVVAFIGGREAMDSILFEVPMVSNVDWGLTTGDLLLVLGLVFLFIELVKSAGSGTATIVNHGLSMVVFVVCRTVRDLDLLRPDVHDADRCRGRLCRDHRRGPS